VGYERARSRGGRADLGSWTLRRTNGKRSFLFTVKPTPFTLICPNWNGAFRKRFSNQRNFITKVLRSSVKGKNLYTKLNENNAVTVILWPPYPPPPPPPPRGHECRPRKSVCSTGEVCWQRAGNSLKWPVRSSNCRFFKFLHLSAQWTGNIFMLFQGDDAIFKFPRRIVDSVWAKRRKQKRALMV